MTVNDFESGVVQRYLEGPYCLPIYKSCGTLRGLAELAWPSDEFDWDEFVDRLATVLSDGDFHYVVAAQKFTPQMTRSLEYLNATVRVGHYHLVQMIQFHGQDMTAYAAQSIMTISRTPQTSARGRIDEASFLDTIDDAAYRDALSDIFDSCRALGLTFGWGTTGSSIRMATPDRSEPLSVGWIFSDIPSWSGLTHLTLGYDRSSAKHTPSVIPALTSYLEQVSSVTGASAVKSKPLNAYTWTPRQVIASKVQIIKALEMLVAAASGEERNGSATTA
jgi:hypothetical protein